jgi:hypothetical protein
MHLAGTRGEVGGQENGLPILSRPLPPILPPSLSLREEREEPGGAGGYRKWKGRRRISIIHLSPPADPDWTFTLGRSGPAGRRRRLSSPPTLPWAAIVASRLPQLFFLQQNSFPSSLIMSPKTSAAKKHAEELKTNEV